MPETGGLDPATLFARPIEDIWLEIGYGGGEHLAAQAQAHPAIGLIGSEVFENGIARLLAAVEQGGFSNIRLLTDDGRELLKKLPDRSLGRVFILFPDPWRKQRHHKRRLVSVETLDELARVMKDGAELRLATDHIDYLRWMLERAPVHPAFEWLARRPEDWRNRLPDWPQTRYERKAIAAGRVPHFLLLRRRPR